MDWQALVIPIVTALATSGTLAAIINANVSKKLGKEANEIEASKNENSVWEGYSKEIREMLLLERDRFHEERQTIQSQLEDIQQEFKELQGRLSRMERREVKATRYIEKLKDHIWNGRPPPPPQSDFELD